jgi:hypothetical protein
MTYNTWMTAHDVAWSCLASHAWHGRLEHDVTTAPYGTMTPLLPLLEKKAKPPRMERRQ